MAELLEYTFFQHALLGSLLASIACGILGTYIVTRRLVFITGGLTHASFGGVGLGLFLGISPILSAALFAVLSSFGVQYFSSKGVMRQDSAIAVFWTLGMALGIILTFLSAGFAPDLSTYLFGNILIISTSDLWFIAMLCIVTGVFFFLYINQIILIAFDADFARTRGIPVTLMEYALMALTALAIVACLRMVGIVLVMSLLTVPQMTAGLYIRNFRGIILTAIATGFASCLIGLWISYETNVPSGATIIFCSIGIYLLCRFERMLASRLQRSARFSKS